MQEKKNIGKTYEGTEEYVAFLYKKHRNDYIWILNTCRKGQELLDAVYYLANDHNVFFDYINENTDSIIATYGDTRKVSADIYIDNSAMTAANFLNKPNEEVFAS